MSEAIARPSDADKATKLYLCNAFLIRVKSCVKTELNDLRIGSTGSYMRTQELEDLTRD